MFLSRTGQFYSPEKPQYRPAEIPKQVKPSDNLKTEGVLYTPEKKPVGPGEKRKPIKHSDNLRPEGAFERPEKPGYSPSERPKPIRPTDNLKTTGEFEKTKKPEYIPAERPKQVKPVDNLKTEGDIYTPEKPKYKPAERPVVKKPVDNLKITGEFEGRRTTEVVTKGERAQIKKHTDQIQLNEGKMESTTTSSSSFTVVKPEKKVVDETSRKRLMKSHITLGDDTSIMKTTNQMNQMNTITTRKDQRVVKENVEDINKIQDGTIAVTTKKVTTVLESDRRPTPVREVIRSGSQTKIREETVHTSSNTNVVNKQNIVNKTNVLNEVHNVQNIVNEKNIRNIQNTNELATKDRHTVNASTTGQQITDRHTNFDNMRDSTTKQTQKDTSSSSIRKESHSSTNESNNVGKSVISKSTTERRHGTHIVDGSDINIDNNRISIALRDSHRSSDILNQKTAPAGISTSDVSQRHVKNTQLSESQSHGSVHSSRNVTTKQAHESHQSYQSSGSTSQANSSQRTVQQQINGDIHNGTSRPSLSTRDDVTINQLNLRKNENDGTIHRSTLTSSHHTSNVGNVSTESHSTQRHTHTTQHRRDYVSPSRAAITSSQNLQSQHHDHQSQNQHHRKNTLLSSSDVTNSIFHRKDNLSSNSNEALHSNSMSTTGAIQRKSISNLHDQGIYSTSSDRKSYSSLHRQGKETSSSHSSSMASHSTGNIVGAGERATKIIKKNNLTVGGEFFGESESKSYGRFTSGHHSLDRQVVNRRANQSSITIGDGRSGSTSVYKTEFVKSHDGPCPAAHMEKSTFTHTRDTKSHKFYKPSLQ